jgi:hypothetical protein
VSSARAQRPPVFTKNLHQNWRGAGVVSIKMTDQFMKAVFARRLLEISKQLPHLQAGGWRKQLPHSQTAVWNPSQQQ